MSWSCKYFTPDRIDLNLHNQSPLHHQLRKTSQTSKALADRIEFPLRMDYLETIASGEREWNRRREIHAPKDGDGVGLGKFTLLGDAIKELAADCELEGEVVF